MTTQQLIKKISDFRENQNCIFHLIRLTNEISKIKLSKKAEKIWIEFLQTI
jgi:hypothetical protein